jgi:hypothetical protein
VKLLSLLMKAAAAVAVLCLLAGAILGVRQQMEKISVENGLVTVDIAENVPPAIAFTTVALGSFRGLVADLLWLRQSRLQEEGNYFEMVQLASWITKLQPRFTGATAYLAWNMAYNISVTFNDFEDRWRWVQRGIELIRDEALLYNPGDPELFKELGWIYQHKLGQEMDDANRYYKLQLARQLVGILGEYPVDWAAWASSPRIPEELAASLGPDNLLWGVLEENSLTLADLERLFRDQGTMPEPFAARLAAADDTLATLTLYFRVRWLQDKLKLDARRIHALNEAYGEFDWRLPEAHAVYWASRGLEVAEQGIDIACERMIFQSLSNAFRGGRMIWLADADTLEITPNINLVDAVNQEYLDTISKHPENQSIRGGYENFLVDAVVTLYIFGREEKAKEYYTFLRENYAKPNYRQPLDQFVLSEFGGDIATANYDQGLAAVQGYLFQMFRALAVGDYDRAEAFERIADQVWRKYMKSIGQGSVQRRGLPPYRQMKRNMYERCLAAFPPPLRVRLEQAAKDAGVEVEAPTAEEPAAEP